MSRTARAATNRILQMVNDGALDARGALLAALNHMSAYDVADMARANESQMCPGCSAIW